MNDFAFEFGFTTDQLDALNTRAFDLVQAGDLEGATVILRGLIALSPDEPSYRASLGSTLQQQGQLAEAEAEYTAALALWPKAPLALVNRGELRCQRGDLGGLDDLRAAAQLKSPVRTKAEALLRRFSAAS